MIDRRSFLRFSITAAAAPIIVRASSLMTIKPMLVSIPRQQFEIMDHGTVKMWAQKLFRESLKQSYAGHLEIA